jgi:hypothetical protein
MFCASMGTSHANLVLSEGRVFVGKDHFVCVNHIFNLEYMRIQDLFHAKRAL